MLAANYSEFRNNLKKYLDDIENNNEVLILKRKTGQGTVIMSLDEYNSIMETLHVKSSQTNANRINESIRQYEDGKIFRNDLIQ